MNRRDFITLLGGAAAAWPLAARAQQPERMRRVGVLMALAETDMEVQARVAAFRQELRKSGWSEGANLRIDERWATDNMEHVRAYATELVKLKPDAILVGGRRAVSVLQQQTRSIPVVFAGISDPVETGVVASLARPGGNFTGFTGFDAPDDWQVSRDAEADRAPSQAHGSHIQSRQSSYCFLSTRLRSGCYGPWHPAYHNANSSSGRH